MNVLDYAGTAKNILVKKDPVQVILFVTARCNFRCKMCFYWEEIDSAKRSLELRLDEIEKISASMKPFPWLLIGGGEPFVRKDLADIAGVFARQNGVKNVTIPTNAFFTERIIEQTERMVTENPNTFVNVDVSIQGPTAALHDEIVMIPGSFAKLHETWRELDKLRSRHKNLGLGTIMTMSGYNQHVWRESLDYIIDAFPFDNLVMTKTRGTPKHGEAKEVDLEEYKRASAYLRERVHDRSIRSFDFPLGGLLLAKDIVSRQLITETTEQDREQLPCYAGIINAVISEYGEVFPCEILNRKLGSLRQVNYDFQQIWTGQAAMETRKFIRDTHCYCTHECFMATNILFNPAMYPRVAKEWASLKAARLGKTSTPVTPRTLEQTT